jgi:hypothetical protein
VAPVHPKPHTGRNLPAPPADSRKAGYRSTDYTHELVAEIYALLVARRQRKASGRPSWLNDEIYNLVKRVTGWSD